MRTSTFVIFLMTLLLAGNAIAAAQRAPSSVELNVLHELNSIRSGYGLHGLRPERAAENAAAVHARELGARMTLSHRGLDGTRVNERYRLAGGTALFSGENLGAGDSTDSIIRAWMDSSSHRANILNPDWFQAGVGSWLLEGDRIILVVVFSASRWEQSEASPTDGFLILSGTLVLRDGLVPEEISMVSDKVKYMPTTMRFTGSGEMELTFQLPLDDNWESGKKYSVFVNLVEQGTHRVSDLLLIGKPGIL